jgi:preprotein translocase subunit SecE
VGENLKYFIFGGVALVAFLYLWRKGHLRRLADYVRETREELKKCTWPSVEELKGSTVVVIISTVLLGGFTMGADFLITQLVRLIM